MDWEFVGPAFEEKPDWRESAGVWAPDATRFRGEYLLYCSLSSWGDPNPWVGETPRRVLLLDRLRWRDGWPTVPGGSPGRTAPKPSVTGTSRATYRET